MRIPAFCLIGLIAIGLAGGGHASAQAAEVVCKGLANDACKASDACSWVKAHKIKSGKEVAGFCRKKPTRQSAKPKAPAKAS